MRGTLVNTAAVIIGGLIGLLLKKGIKDSYRNSINIALGISVALIGINGIITNMLSVTPEGALKSEGELLLVVSTVVGTFIGELLNIQGTIEGMSAKIENRFKLADFSSGFVSATVLFCVGAMAIIGSVNDGLRADSSVLYVKSMLDFVSSVILASSLGYGVIFASISVLIYQGMISCFAGFLGSILTGALLNRVCAAGYLIIICIGINFAFEKKIKTANMLPSMFIPVIWHYISLIFK